MFPTTVWTVIRQAGEADDAALEHFAREYRSPVLAFLRQRGYGEGDAEDLCQDVFLRVLRGGVLSKADRGRGRFRSLLLSVARHAALDRERKQREFAEPELEEQLVDEDATDPEFDREWVLLLSQRALARLEAEGSPYHAVLRGHLDGVSQDRNKLWIARKKLRELLKHEVALTCDSPTAIEAELEYLSQYLAP